MPRIRPYKSVSRIPTDYAISTINPEEPAGKAERPYAVVYQGRPAARRVAQVHTPIREPLMPPTKRNHSVSRFYLAAWASEPGLIYRFDKTTKNWGKRSLKKQAGRLTREPNSFWGWKRGSESRCS